MRKLTPNRRPDLRYFLWNRGDLAVPSVTRAGLPGLPLHETERQQQFPLPRFRPLRAHGYKPTPGAC